MRIFVTKEDVVEYLEELVGLELLFRYEDDDYLRPGGGALRDGKFGYQYYRPIRHDNGWIIGRVLCDEHGKVLCNEQLSGSYTP